MRRILATLALCVMAYTPVGARETQRVLFDFEGSDTATLQGIQRSSEQAKTGRASGKWERHTTMPRVVSGDIPHDWSGFDTLSLWIYSATANGAEVMLVLHSENEATSGPDYFCHPIKVSWTGWRPVEIEFEAITSVRSPVGWNRIDDFGFHTTGWGNAPKADTVLYIDDVRLMHYGSSLRNASFNSDTDGDNVPDSWQFSPQGKDATGQVTWEDGGRTGKCVKIVDKEKKRGFGVMQYVPAKPGKTYQLTAWKKGDGLVYYLNFYGGDRKIIGREHTKMMANKNKAEWEEFSLTSTAPEGTESVRVWFYSPSSNLGTFYVDDATLEETD